VEALREFAHLSRLQFDYGVASYLEVLVADNELFAAELELVRLRTERYTQVVNVYSAVGGGWVDTAVKLTSPPAATMRAP
jgi:multidrug efflux system outer membrane protein